MRFYKTVAINNLKEEILEDVNIRWDGTQSDAATTRKNMVAEGYRRKDVETFEVDVPTDKAGLLAWLNVNAIDAAK